MGVTFWWSIYRRRSRNEWLRPPCRYQQHWRAVQWPGWSRPKVAPATLSGLQNPFLDDDQPCGALCAPAAGGLPAIRQEAAREIARPANRTRTGDSLRARRKMSGARVSGAALLVCGFCRFDYGRPLGTCQGLLY